MTLHYRHFGEGRPFIILHGLFGSSDNWLTLGKRFAEDRSVYLVDQRNHGQSPHSDEFDYRILAEDLREFIRQHNLEKVTVLGHSMGGKAGMFFAQMYPELLDSLIVIDMGIRRYRPHHDDILEAFEAIRPESLENRKQAEERIAPIIDDRGVRQFLLKNLYRRKDGTYGIRVNFQVIKDRMDNILEELPQTPVDLPVLFVVGGKSRYILPEDHASIREVFPQVEFVTLPAGHWVHAEDPDGVFNAVTDFETK